MALQYSTTVINAQLDTVESTIGTSAVLEIRTGAAPASAGAADSGTMLVSMQLPSDWLAAASGGAKAKAGTWSTAATTAGTAAHFRIKNNTAATTHIQGSVTATGGGGDLTLDNTSITGGQTVTINTFTITGGNA